MIATDKFNYIHFPKSGGTFVTDSLFQLYELDWSIWKGLIMVLKGSIKYNNPNYGTFHFHGAKHGRRNEILDNFKRRIILSNVRNPMDLYVSQYEFGWWKRKKYLKYYRGIKDFKTLFKNFPNLSFQEFLELEYYSYSFTFNEDFNCEKSLGLATQSFLKFFADNPETIAKNYFSGKLSVTDIENQHLSNINFLYTHNLNQGLYDFLKQMGFPEEKITFILSKEKTHPLGKGRTKEQKWEKYYTPELKSLILKKDRMLFELFPDFLI